jgi:hypothetical protein
MICHCGIKKSVSHYYLYNRAIFYCSAAVRLVLAENQHNYE